MTDRQRADLWYSYLGTEQRLLMWAEILDDLDHYYIQGDAPYQTLARLEQTIDPDELSQLILTYWKERIRNEEENEENS